MAKEELLEEGTYLNQMSKEELAYFLENFETFKQRRKKAKARRAYDKKKERKDARRIKKDLREYFEEV